MTAPKFHVAIAVHDLDKARDFYGRVLGCQEGRSAERWIDFNFFGHQLSVHLKADECGPSLTNPVDGDKVPVRHFGLILPWQLWHEKAELWRDFDFVISPRIRFAGEVGEQATMFFKDPSGNALEFKSFKDPEDVFRT
jgi:uncharacterized protein